MARLDDTNALVTGASRGIGRGVAEGLAEAGARVAVNHPPGADERAGAEDAVEAIRDGGREAMTLEGDVSDAESVTEMVETFESAYGPVDVLVNNAGILTQSRLEDMSVEMWDETIAVDLRGVFLTTRFALPGMLESGGGAVVNVASQLGLIGGEELVHYSAAKGGVVAFTRALAREVSPEVRVNAVAPGPVETALLDDITEEWRQDKQASLPMDRLGRVGDIVPTVVFLASDDAAYYTGQTLSPDGGDAMH